MSPGHQLWNLDFVVSTPAVREGGGSLVCFLVLDPKSKKRFQDWCDTTAWQPRGISLRRGLGRISQRRGLRRKWKGVRNGCPGGLALRTALSEPLRWCVYLQMATLTIHLSSF